MSSIINLFNKRYKRHLIAHDIPYNNASKLDIYRDDRQGIKTDLLVIILWHGGSWRRGDKAIYPYVADYIVRNTGAIVILPNYQHYPEVTYPHFIDEAWQVVDWMQSHISEYGGDPRRYSVIGNSAGAHTSAFVSLGFRKPTHLSVPEKSVDLAGPTTTAGKAYWPIFDMNTLDNSRFPAHFVARASQIKQTKFLIVHGRHDRIVAPVQSEKFLLALQQRNASAQIIRPHIGHIGLIIGLGSPFATWTVYARQVVQFLKDTKG